MTLSLSHALHCPACGLFGRRARRRAREADEALLVNFHRHQAKLARAARRQAWLDSLPDDIPPWQVRAMEALAHDLALYFGPGGDGGTLTAMPYQHPQHRPLLGTTGDGWTPEEYQDADGRWVRPGEGQL